MAGVARTYGKLEINAGAWVLSEIEPHVCIRLKQIFQRIPKTQTSPFKMVRSMGVDADLKWFCERYPLLADEAVTRALHDGHAAYLNNQAELEAIALPTYRPGLFTGMRDGWTLRDYQGQAVDLAYLSHGLLVGDDCGLGKTFEGLGLCLRPGTLPAAVVCGGNVQRQWVKQFEAVTHLRACEIATLNPYKLPEADVYVFRYSQIRGWTDIFGTGFFKSVIYDEPQELRTGTLSSKGAAAKVLSAHAEWRLGLTATPIYGYGVEIWNVMQFIRPDVLGARDDFTREWCAADWKRISDPRALGTFLREQHAFLRRTKADVGRELDPVNRIVDYVEYNQKEVDSIEDLARSLAITATTGSFEERGLATRELSMRVRQATGVAKAHSVAARARIIVEAGEPLILFGWHREVYDIWLRDLVDLKPVMYTGSESPKQKRESIEAFTSGKTDLMFMSLRSAAGIDGLQHRCSTVGFGELDPTPGCHHQCIERVSRDGQTKPVMALFWVCDDGSDPPLMEVLGIKASDAAQVIDPTLQAAEVHSDEGPMRALVRRYLERSAPQRAEAA